MEKNNSSLSNPRRKFIGNLAASAAGIGFALSLPAQLNAAPHTDRNPELAEADVWFNRVKGKHRIMYDVPHPNETFPFAWPRIFLVTNQQTGSAASDCGVVVVLLFLQEKKTSIQKAASNCFIDNFANRPCQTNKV